MWPIKCKPFVSCVCREASPLDCLHSFRKSSEWVDRQVCVFFHVGCFIYITAFSIYGFWFGGVDNNSNREQLIRKYVISFQLLINGKMSLFYGLDFSKHLKLRMLRKWISLIYDFLSIWRINNRHEKNTQRYKVILI